MAHLFKITSKSKSLPIKIKSSSNYNLQLDKNNIIIIKYNQIITNDTINSSLSNLLRDFNSNYRGTQLKKQFDISYKKDTTEIDKLKKLIALLVHIEISNNPNFKKIFEKEIDIYIFIAELQRELLFNTTENSITKSTEEIKKLNLIKEKIYKKIDETKNKYDKLVEKLKEITNISNQEYIEQLIIMHLNCYNIPIGDKITNIEKLIELLTENKEQPHTGNLIDLGGYKSIKKK